MNRFGMLLAAQALVGVAVCQAPSNLEPLPKQGMPAIGKQPLALYWLSKTDGSVWRASLDGTRKELVVETKVKGRSSVGVGGGRPAKGSYMVLSSVPYRGYTVLDIPPKTVPGKPIAPVIEGAKRSGKFEPVPYTYSNVRSDWKARVKMKGFRVIDHTHQEMGEIQFQSKGSQPRTFSFSTPESQMIALLEGDAVLLKVADKVILWTLKDDRRYLFAEAWNCGIWTRDLSKPGRHTPVAKVLTKRASYTYKLSNPQDIKRPVTAMTKLRAW